MLEFSGDLFPVDRCGNMVVPSKIKVCALSDPLVAVCDGLLLLRATVSLLYSHVSDTH
jgi:hypothetical protein